MDGQELRDRLVDIIAADKRQQDFVDVHCNLSPYSSNVRKIADGYPQELISEIGRLKAGLAEAESSLKQSQYTCRKYHGDLEESERRLRQAQDSSVGQHAHISSHQMLTSV